MPAYAIRFDAEPIATLRLITKADRVAAASVVNVYATDQSNDYIITLDLKSGKQIMGVPHSASIVDQWVWLNLIEKRESETDYQDDSEPEEDMVDIDLRDVAEIAIRVVFDIQVEEA